MRLEVKDLEFGYGDVTILKGISMELAPSELLAGRAQHIVYIFSSAR